MTKMRTVRYGSSVTVVTCQVNKLTQCVYPDWDKCSITRLDYGIW